ncbi:MAG: peptidylprolyl isomerase [Actinomycetota bacterium]
MKIPPKASFILLLVVALSATACGTVFGSAVAVVNGRRVTDHDLQQEIVAIRGSAPAGTSELDVERQAILQLIQNTLVDQVAEQRHIVPTATDIEQQLAQVRGQFQDEATFQQQLKAAGLTLPTLRERIKSQLIAEKLRAALATPITADEVRTVYEREKDQFRQLKVEHILFQVSGTKTDAQALKQAKDVLAQLKAGADFATLAKKLSDDQGTKAAGGKIDQWLTVADPNLDQTFAQAAWAATIGKPTNPVRSQFGYHIIVTLAKRIQPFSEVEPTLRQQLESQAGDRALTDFANALVAKATIVVNPRYGDWDAKSQSIVAHEFFRPAPGESPSASPTPVVTLAPSPTPSG